MKWHKVWALFCMDMLLLVRLRWRVAEFIYFPLITILIWGFFAIYSQMFAPAVGILILAVTVVWNVGSVGQSSMNFAVMEDSWSSSMRSILVTNISATEYILARVFSSALVATFVGIISIGAASLFGWHPYSMLPSIALVCLFAFLAAIGIGLMFTGMLIQLGKEYGFISWSGIQVLILLSSPFYPLEILPSVLQYIAKVMPFTYPFMLMRELNTIGTMQTSTLVLGIVASGAYFVIGWPLYLYSFRQGKRSGNLLRFAK